jgi:5-carboxymethyl-2-hydroxymuconate isomerase
LQFSSNLEGALDDGVLAAINLAASESDLFDELDIKTRAIAFDRWQVGTASRERGFLHLVVAMAPRSAALEGSLSKALADALERSVRMPQGVCVQLCVEIVHVDTGTYVKRTSGL